MRADTHTHNVALDDLMIGNIVMFLNSHVSLKKICLFTRTTTIVQVVDIFQITALLLGWKKHLIGLYLGGGNSNMFYFHPWEDDPIWVYLSCVYFSTGLVKNHQPDTRCFTIGGGSPKPPTTTSCFTQALEVKYPKQWLGGADLGPPLGQ